MNRNTTRDDVNRRWVVSSILILSLLLFSFGALSAGATPLPQDNRGMASFSSNLAADTRQSTPSLPLQLELPDQAEVGDLVTFTLKGNGAQNLAGFQAELRYDYTGLELVEMNVLPDLSASGKSPVVLGPVTLPGVIHLGAAVCPVADCSSTDYQNAPRQPLELAENAVLATFSFKVRLPGSYQIQLDNPRLVDPQGASALSAAPSPGSPASVDLEKLDITGNGIINDSDAWAVVAAWADLAETGRCMGEDYTRYDVDGSGCLDIGDVQMILSQWGQPVSPTVALPGSSALPQANFLQAALELTVDSSGDASDASPGDGVCSAVGGGCTLRAAIEESNSHPGQELIRFNILNTNGSCPSLVTIEPGNPLEVDDPTGSGVIIDGYTQCGASPNSQPINGNAVIKIEIKGSLTPGEDGLTLHSANNTVRGLAMYNSHNQIRIIGQKGHDNHIEGNFIGTNAAISLKTTFPDAESEGIRLAFGASNNTIGGVTPDKRNIVSGNDQDGIGFQGPPVIGNVVIGNYTGLKQDGATAWGNKADGIDLATGASNNIIGGLEPGQRNVISGNLRDGIEISHELSVSGNRVLGNFIGIRADGTQATPNKNKGVTFEDLVELNEVYRNVISGNGGWGVRIYTSNENKVYDNFIGVLPTGIGPNNVIPSPNDVSDADLIAMPNGAIPAENSDLSGVYITGGSQSNLLQNNIIAYHTEYGIKVDAEIGYLGLSCEAYFNTFTRNRIYANGKLGIYLKSGVCGETTYRPNQNIQPPTLTNVNTTQAFGTTCPNCVVEVFISDKTSVPDPENAGEGKVFVGSSTADGSGNFLVVLGGVSIGQVLTATTTDGSGNTSMFANNVLVTTAGPVIDPTPPPPPPPPGNGNHQRFLPFIHK